MKTSVALLLFAAVCFGGGPGQAAPETGGWARPAESPPSVAVVLPDEDDFWLRFQAALEERAGRLDLKLVNSGGNQMRQNAQVGRLMAQPPKPQVLILAAHDALGAAAAVRKARAAKVKVLSLDRLTLNADLDFHLAYDHEGAGEAQARKLADEAGPGLYILISGPPNSYSAYLARKGALKALEPLRGAGRLTVLAGGAAFYGEVGAARAQVRAALAREAAPPAAVLVPDDDAAAEAAAALREAGLAGRVPVVSQSSRLTAARLLLDGDLNLSVYKDPELLAEKALGLAVKMARGEDLAGETTEVVHNGRQGVPAALLAPRGLTLEDLEAARAKPARAGQLPAVGGRERWKR